MYVTRYKLFVRFPHSMEVFQSVFQCVYSLYVVYTYALVLNLNSGP